MILHTNTGYSSPYAMSVFVALKEKALPFELALVDDVYRIDERSDRRMAAR
jgi:glutathione S-transferase